MMNNNSKPISGGGLGVANRVRSRHSSLNEQMRHGSTTTSDSPLPRSTAGNGGSIPPLRRGSKGLNSSSNDPLGNTASSVSSLKKSTPGSSGLDGSHSKVKGMLTQLPEIGGNGMQSVTKKRNSSVNDQQLTAWRRQPKNLSPAAGLKLPAMLPPPLPTKKSKILLCLDIDETLVHASFTPAKPYNVKITIDVDGERGDIFVAYRPHVHEFLQAVGQMFEIAIFTASQSCYANPLMDALDPEGVLGRNRMFRQHCTEVNGARVKDMSLLGRNLDRVCILDNSPVAYLFQPRNAIPIQSWFDDPNDTELLKLLPMLRDLAMADTVYDVLDPFNCHKSSA